jgi:hypothetical protein
MATSQAGFIGHPYQSQGLAQGHGEGTVPPLGPDLRRTPAAGARSTVVGEQRQVA